MAGSPMEEVTRCDGCEHEDACPPGDTCIAALEDQIEVVRAARKSLAEMRDHAEAERTAFEVAHEIELDALQGLGDSCIGAGKILAAEEARLRKLTIEAYEATGSKKPAMGVGVRISKNLSYDEAAVKQWALKENPGFLVLDRPGFEAYAKALLKMGRSIPNVMLQEEEKPQATIAKEL